MELREGGSVASSIARLDELDEAHLGLGHKMFEAFGGTMYGMDLLAAGALNRSKAHIAGFRQLVHSKNLVCAGALLRLQLDTALRFHAAWLVEDPHDFALAVLRGERVRNMKDRSGKKMTDAYLVETLGTEHSWVPRVYERTSGYVHLSDTHLLSAMSPAAGSDDSNRLVNIKISAEDQHLPDWIYVEAVDAFCAATEILLKYVQGWATTKASPELAQDRTRESGSTRGGA